MRISKLTNLPLDVNATLVSGKCSVSKDEVWQPIADGTIFEFIGEHLEYGGALGVLEPVDRLSNVGHGHRRIQSFLRPFRHPAAMPIAA